jgi:antitoxin component YwqK of YwqJK toxin-antitoxin module
MNTTRLTTWQFRRGAILCLVALGAVFALLVHRPTPKTSRAGISLAPLELSRTNLVFKESRLLEINGATPFSGFMVEHYTDGVLRSRSAVTNGLLHGLSQGWHTNGQLQVSEYFKAGVSHGLRTKWYANGTKLSEATIVEGVLSGPFRRWHENGTLAEEVEMRNGQPDGIANAYLPDGRLKTQVRLENGKVINQTPQKQGEPGASMARKGVIRSG